MRLLIEAHHPAHIHFFKNAVRVWKARGDEVLLIARDRDVMRHLLDAYDWIPSTVVSTAGRNNRLPVAEMLERQYGLARSIAAFRPDVVLSLMGSYTQSAFLFRVPNVVFTDSEFQTFNHRIAHPFATRIYTPECFWKNLGPKQHRYRGYHELAFLHPAWYSPDPSILGDIGLEPHEYLILRTSAWNTLHDIGEGGFGPLLDTFIARIGDRLPVRIVPEGGALPERWEPLRLRITPERFHDVLAFARLVVTEGASTASEAACLGVPAVFLNSTERGYLNDQARRYGIVHNFRQPADAIERTMRLLDDPPSLAWRAKTRERLVADHIDVTRFVIDEIDGLLS
jgi:uncharacterized protein